MLRVRLRPEPGHQGPIRPHYRGRGRCRGGRPEGGWGRSRHLSAWRQIDADVRLVHSTSLRDVRDAGGFTAYSSRLTDHGIDAVNLRAREWTQESATEGLPVLRASGLRAFGWGAQSNRTLRRLVRFGLNGIYSDHVARLVTATRVGRADPA